MAATNISTHTNTNASALKDERRLQGGAGEANGSMNGGLNGNESGTKVSLSKFLV
jgi:hypothetical protein